MCGIMGCLGPPPSDRAWRLAKEIQLPRGPDGQGEVRGVMGRIPFAIAHQRLAIIDTTPTGAQPMVHPETGSALLFNGEIYNYVEIRSELLKLGKVFRGSSDTEVLLHSLETWGIDKALPRLNGAWAFAWLRPNHGTAYLCRDRFGEKPLHIVHEGRSLVFASDLRAAATLAERRFRPDHKSLARFLTLGTLEVDRRTMFDGVLHVPSATYIKIDVRGEMPRTSDPVSYWVCPTDVATPLPRAEFVESLRALVCDSVRMRLRSDVPVGILLSGGLDSSAIAACAALNADQSVNLLSSVDESASSGDTPFVTMMERHLARPVTRIQLPHSSSTVFDELAQTVRRTGLPHNSLAILAHGLLMREARRSGIKVVLSGQGADEALCGYRKYLGFAVLDFIRHGQLTRASRMLSRFLLNRTVLPQFSIGEGKRYLPWGRVNHRRLGHRLRTEEVEFAGLAIGETISERQRRDLTSLSVPTLNVLEDRSSMAHSCEVRLPYLDHRIMELTIPAPVQFKLHRGWTKVSLREAFEDLLPSGIAWRRDKQGFCNPEGRLLRTTLRHHFASQFLDPNCRMYRDGFLDHTHAVTTFERFCSARRPTKPWVRDFIQMITLEMWLADSEGLLGSC